MIEPSITCLQGDSNFEMMKSTVQHNYLSDRFRGKKEMLTLNGGFARVSGRTRYNNIQIMTNGMLTSIASDVTDTMELAESVSRLYHSLEEKGIPFLFVLTPYKSTAEESLFPTGVSDITGLVADQTLAQMTERNVPVLDLRKEMGQTREQIEKYFYRTDHHWNAEGAFVAYQQIMKELKKNNPEMKVTYADASLWEKTVLPHWWLGSAGARVGPLFAGVDDMDYYLPAFKTEMSRYSIGHWAAKGDFRKACMQEWYLEKPNYFDSEYYSRYLGGGYALTLHRNQYAENQKKFLIIRDSFMLPLECFLSTEFSSIDVIDPRLYFKMTEADYIALNPPDMVLMMICPGVLTSSYYANYIDFESVKELETVRETVDEEIVVSGSSGGEGYDVLQAPLESGKSYVLTMDQIQVLEGAPEGANVALCDGENTVDQTVFDIEYGNEFGLRWGFQIPGDEEGAEEDHDYQLRFYAGISGATEDVTLVYQKIRLQECLLLERQE